MKLTKGSLKVVVSNPADVEENAERARAGGKIFRPVFIVFEWNEDLQSLDIHQAVSVTFKGGKFRTALRGVPYKWAPSRLKEFALWVETTEELTISSTEEI